MLPGFYVSSAVAVISTVLMITRLRVIHSLLYLVISMLAIAVMFYTLGAPFVAALEGIVYAGAIMVLFVFITMTLNLDDGSLENQNCWMGYVAWICPLILTAALTAEFVYTAISAAGNYPLGGPIVAHVIEPKQVGMVLFGPYLLGVELVSMLLLAGIVGAYRLGWIPPDEETEVREEITEERKEPASALEPAGQRTVAGVDLVHTGPGRPDHAA